MKTPEKIRETIKSCRELAQEYREEDGLTDPLHKLRKKWLFERAQEQELMAFTLEWVLEA